jgi:hypothetical protein
MLGDLPSLILIINRKSYSTHRVTRRITDTNIVCNTIAMRMELEAFLAKSHTALLYI